MITKDFPWSWPYWLPSCHPDLVAETYDDLRDFFSELISYFVHSPKNRQLSLSAINT